jgi:hypothetical protein
MNSQVAAIADRQQEAIANGPNNHIRHGEEINKSC